MRRLSWAAPLIGFAIFFCIAMRQGGQRVFMPGPVSGQHTPFGERCDSCHERDNGQWGAVLDSKCMVCHDAPVHSQFTVHASGNMQKQLIAGKEISINTPGCVSCHTEHRGHTRLAELNNGLCVQCHANLKRSDSRPPDVTANIRDFGHSHTDWRVLRAGLPDDTPYRLDHKLHCDPDQVTWPKNIADQAARNPGVICSQCHQPDQGRAYFKPINYDSHCAKCHGMEKFAPAVEPVGKLAITHGDPKRVAAEITSQISTYLFQHGGNPTFLNAAPAKPTDDDDDGPKKKAAVAETRNSEQWVHDTVQKALQPLYFPLSVEKEGKSCLKCHVGAKLDEAGLLQISQQKIPAVWLRKAQFDHHAHQTVACISCHKSATQSAFTTDILLPGIANCRACHSTEGGAKTDCVECHRFHDRELAVFKPGRSIEGLSSGHTSRYALIRTSAENEAVLKDMTDAEIWRLDDLLAAHKAFDAAQNTELSKRAEEQRAREKLLAPAVVPDKTAVKPVEPVKPVEVVKPVEPVKPVAVVPEPAKSITLKPLPVGTIQCPNCKKSWPGDAQFCGRCGIHIEPPK